MSEQVQTVKMNRHADHMVSPNTISRFIRKLKKSECRRYLISCVVQIEHGPACVRLRCPILIVFVEKKTV